MCSGRSALLAVLLCGLPLTAQQAASIRGRAVDSATGQPLSRVHVRLLVPSRDQIVSAAYGAISDDAGDGSVESDGLIFRIPGAVVGRYWVKAEDARGENVWVKAVRVDSHEAPGRILDLRGPPANVTLLLSTAGARISGTVEDDKGPVEGAEVQLVSENKDGQRPHSVHTDWKGAYSFPAIPPGKYTISVRMPSRDNLQAAEEIEVSEGDRITKNLKVRR